MKRGWKKSQHSDLARSIWMQIQFRHFPFLWSYLEGNMIYFRYYQISVRNISDHFSKDFEPEKKKLICRTLRFIAHLHGATLQFYSAKDPGLVKKVFIRLIMINHQTIHLIFPGSRLTLPFCLQLCCGERDVPRLQ